MTRNPLGVLASPAEWRAALDSLPDLTATKGRIPSFFFAHGSPILIWPPGEPNSREGMFGKVSAPDGLLVQFLRDFGKTLLTKYKPKGIVVFSAHWETDNERLVTDYGDENPLLYDYYGFPQSLYDLTWRSRGSKQLSERIVQEFRKAGMAARTTPVTEPRGRDGRRINKPKVQSGLDHGVFVPFKVMFPGDSPFEVPVVEVSISSDLRPETEYEIGKALKALRDEGLLILSGGLTIHSFEDLSSFNEERAKTPFHDWNQKIVDAVNKQGTPDERKRALFDLTKQREFRLAHPREEHFVPLYCAAGAGDGGEQKLLSGLYGATTIAFGL
ncbi:Extradiol ring-cleavage dioxygenase class III enzyme subunit B [Cystobasidium minutum MCA 4210]|uniref:Extradiol ring-cleavage dioxygenase class III enzyme subunit B n=1 Tax=Cystobasidium minutum MCA 4210 TaxID=1397322 RepID=UPI0034CD2C67|eukprot:jgi/Rhomi1/187734/estExt_fgenesh1_pg.C_1_t30101